MALVNTWLEHWMAPFCNNILRMRLVYRHIFMIPLYVLNKIMFKNELLTWDISHIVFRNRWAYSQVFISYLVQKSNSEVFGENARNYCLPDGISALSNGHTVLSYLHRKLLVFKHFGPFFTSHCMIFIVFPSLLLFIVPIVFY